MEIGKRGGLLTVIAPIKDTPAYRAGIETGDIIVKINGEQSHDLPVETAVSKIRGPKGSQVTLTLSRASKNNGKEFDITVTRDTIELPTVDFQKRDDGVFVIELYMFNGQAPRKMADALYEYEKSGYKKLIIDLRGNPGGYLEAAVDMASWFVPKGEVIVTQDYANQDDEVYRSSGVGSLFPGTEIAILLNGGSASASEIFAGALRDHGRATLIGEQSFGKGSVQQVFDVTEDTSLKITIARWLTPKNVSISHEGLTPDIKVEIPTTVKEGEDPILDRAVEFLLTGK
jgi:carboxyl-terminal processing protease